MKTPYSKTTIKDITVALRVKVYPEEEIQISLGDVSLIEQFEC